MTKTEIIDYLSNFVFKDSITEEKSIIEFLEIEGSKIPKFINEFWTSKQRQASSIHEVSYRACFKPQLPRFFIETLTSENDTVYDPFSGRGTTIIEGGILGRQIISNDINPLSNILSYPRFFLPEINRVKERLKSIKYHSDKKAEIDLSMFYHPDTESEIVSLREYLKDRKESGLEDDLDKWIRMVATNRLTGHSGGFFSVYTLPPNQAVTAESQIKINERRNQIPEYKDINSRIIKKTNSLLKDVSPQDRQYLKRVGDTALFLSNDARNTPQITSDSVQLTVTSPPFLNIVQYSQDNWLRCWFNAIDDSEISKQITMSKTIEDWCLVMGDVFKELYRVTKKYGWVAFEVGEVKNGTIRLDEYVVPLGQSAGFECVGIIINSQVFTKTSNIWGISNNSNGTNTNRIVLFQK